MRSVGLGAIELIMNVNVSHAKEALASAVFQSYLFFISNLCKFNFFEVTAHSFLMSIFCFHEYYHSVLIDKLVNISIFGW